jgi:predicted RNA-binding protein Jag
MDQAEASGKTVEDALNRALVKLGARREEVEFVVLDEGKRGGLFGRGGRDAVVRVERTAEAQARAGDRDTVDTRIPRGGRQPRGGRGGGGGRGEARPQARGDRGDRGARGGGRREGGRSLEAAAPKLTEEDFLRGRQAGEARPERPERPARPRAERPDGPARERPTARPRDRGDR